MCMTLIGSPMFSDESTIFFCLCLNSVHTVLSEFIDLATEF